MTGSLRKECDKAAQILKSFVGADKGRIPAQVIANAKGLAIFSGFRAAMYLAGAGGSGVVVARLADGSWSAPSAFSVRSGGIGVVYGVDVYDCVCVLNTREAVDAYMTSEMTMGAGASVAAGPIGGTADISTKEVNPIWTYTKSRGLYGGLTVDGTVIKERPSINVDAYGSGVTAAKILKGEAEWPAKTQLREVLKLAGGESADGKVLGAISTEPTPGDLKE
ncbi:SH3 domain-containing YSC84-like protein 1 [Fonsecaea pedrosoi]|nr:SH3 domain-containing YSC84-like protein 1 [Fonsecaea pedrosoi]